MIICKRCGYKNQDEDADFCASCGRFLEWSGEKVEAPVAAPEAVDEEEEPGRRGFVERVEGWVREQRSGSATDQPPAGGGTVLVADEANQAAAPTAAAAADGGAPGAPASASAPPAAPAPVAPAAVPPAAAGSATPAPAAAVPAEPSEATAEAPVFGPALPVDGETAPADGAAAAPAAPATSDLAGGAEGDGKAGAPADASVPAPAKPAAPVDPLLAAFIAAPVAMVPAIESETPKALKPDLGEREGPSRREAAPERQPGMPVEKGGKEAVFRPAQYAAKPTGPSRVVHDGDLVCPRCGQGNYPWRNYCRRCGLVLEHVKAAAERHGPWAWMWGALSRPVHSRRQRLVRAGERPGRHLRSSPKARSTMRKFKPPKIGGKRATKIVGVLAVLVVALGAFGPWKGRFQSTTSRWWHDLQNTVNISYVTVYPVSVTASSSAAANGPENANDNVLSTFWSSYAPGPPGPVPKKFTNCTTKPGTTTTTKNKTTGKTTTTTTPPKTTCTTTTKLVPSPNLKKYKPITGVGQYLRLDFSQPESIGGFALFTGAQDSSSDFTSYESPKEIELIFSSSPPLRFSVSLAKTLQSWKFVHPDTTFLKIVVLSVYPANTGTVVSKQEVAISDVFAYNRT